VEVFTASLDSVRELADFAEAQTLPFALLSDPDGGVARKYGVLDPSGKYAQRVTFVIDDRGVLRKVVDQVNVRSHGEDLAVLVEELMAE
jgi:peroxiredoxin Q/BCP